MVSTEVPPKRVTELVSNLRARGFRDGVSLVSFDEFQFLTRSGDANAHVSTSNRLRRSTESRSAASGLPVRCTGGAHRTSEGKGYAGQVAEIMASDKEAVFEVEAAKFTVTGGAITVDFDDIRIVTIFLPGPVPLP